MPIKSATRAKSVGAKSDRKAFPKGEYSLHTPKECDQMLKNHPIHLKRCPYDGKEVIRVMEKDGYRRLLVPAKEKSEYPKIISAQEFMNLRERSRTKSDYEKAMELAAAEREKTRLQRESMARKEEIRYMDLKRNLNKKNDRLSEVDEEARQRTMHLLERANNIKMEQEEEVKMCNKIILETKCRAIRDAQLAEKRLLEREQAEEEQRVNKMLEEQRMAEIERDRRRELERAAEQQKFSQYLKEQIQVNEEERHIAFERKREESRILNEYVIANQEAELELMRKKHEEKLKARQEFIETNERMKLYKAMEEAESRVMDQRIQEFQRQKAEREAKIAEEQRLEKMQKEFDKGRAAEQAFLANSLSTHIEELHAARVQEEVEREWRRREKEEAIKKAEALKALRESRDAQVQHKLKLQALEMQREKAEFEKILATQREAMCREQSKTGEKHQKALKHRSDILKQVNEKEKERIANRQKMFQEGLALRAETEQRNKRLRDVMERKYKEMQESQVPDIYVKEVKRMIDNMK